MIRQIKSNKINSNYPCTRALYYRKSFEPSPVFDDGEEEGTYSGPCTCIVDGQKYNDMKIDTLKAKVLNHLKNRGKVFWVGHSEDPEPTWNNVQLYLQMFPWLFPYGLAGIGHLSHKNRLSEAKHKHDLLMYHDKRFQTDLYFPYVIRYC
ncbi:hypothetical protein B0H14DRAFT_2365121 [Mycena olivaceomarginata]|nr:hypothetical protein B0H14DRAFT_2365121 [Mycena olivaceomarginata]